MLKLFYAPGTCALASNIALEEAGAEYETVRLDFGAGDQRKPECCAFHTTSLRCREWQSHQPAA